MFAQNNTYYSIVLGGVSKTLLALLGLIAAVLIEYSVIALISSNAHRISPMTIVSAVGLLVFLAGMIKLRIVH